MKIKNVITQPKCNINYNIYELLNNVAHYRTGLTRVKKYR